MLEKWSKDTEFNNGIELSQVQKLSISRSYLYGELKKLMEVIFMRS